MQYWETPMQNSARRDAVAELRKAIAGNRVADYQALMEAAYPLGHEIAFRKGIMTFCAPALVIRHGLGLRIEIDNLWTGKRRWIYLWDVNEGGVMWRQHEDPNYD